MEAFIGCLVLAAITIVFMCVWEDKPKEPRGEPEPFEPPEFSLPETIRWHMITRDWKRDDNRWGFRPGKDEIF